MNRLGRFCAIAALCGFLAGCASVPWETPPAESPKVAEAPCLPPIVTPNFLTWPIVAVGAGVARVDTGELVPVALVRYQFDGKAVLVHWGRGRLLAVDPNPDTNVAPWIDAGALRTDGSSIRSNMKPCSWLQPGHAVSAGL